jgi:hypothetical protein
MKIGLKNRLLGACVAAAMPCMALADAPSAASVGEIDAILKFCAKIEPRLAGDFESHWELITGGAARGTRGSKEYKEGYDLVSDALAGAGGKAAAEACATLAKKGK